VTSDQAVLLSDDRDGVRTLNRPRRKNAINRELWVALAEALTAADKDPQVITGADGAFCSGADISTSDDSHPVCKLQRLTGVALVLYELRVPESTFSQVFPRRVLSVDLGGSWLLPKIVGLQQAKRLVLLAETIDAAEAHVLNLVT
jgi:enoyl-CoA hydratase/carnithine racemase